MNGTNSFGNIRNTHSFKAVMVFKGYRFVSKYCQHAQQPVTNLYPLCDDMFVHRMGSEYDCVIYGGNIADVCGHV